MGWLSKLFNLDLWTEQTLGNTLPKLPADNAKPEPGQKPETGVGEQSRLDAKSRLKLVLMHDRTQLSSEVLEKMRDEIVEVISKYVAIDKEALEINLESESNTIALVANIPMLKVRTAAASGEAGKPAPLKSETEKPANAKGEEEDAADDLIEVVEAPKAQEQPKEQPKKAGS